MNGAHRPMSRLTRLIAEWGGVIGNWLLAAAIAVAIGYVW
jgi:hypothetical protein